ncbi:MAG: ribonuclease E/G [Lachnospiraceae bacterium]|nr:ribonuclease E/G [Lachnospiraceae bacterium]
MRDYLVTETVFQGRRFMAAAFYEGMRLMNLRVRPREEESCVGQIRTGFVADRVGNIGGVFVQSGREKFFISSFPKDADPGHIVFLVTRDALGNKSPTGTLALELAGRYAVVRQKPRGLSFSGRLSGEEKRILRKWLEGFDARGLGILVRTNAGRAEKKVFLEELAGLAARFSGILEEAGTAGNGKILYRPDPFYVEELDRTRELPDRILTDLPDAFPLLVQKKQLSAELCFYGRENRALTLPELYGLPRELEKLTGRAAWLKSGAYLVIEKTEAFVSIDVNSGKCGKGRIPEETYRKINLEAAEEAVRQIMLRNLSGMILIDFINLKSRDHREELVNVMKKLVRRDPLRMDVIDLTPLGIMEIVRQKGEKSLAERLGLSDQEARRG